MSEQHAEQFDMAMRQARTAWSGTPMLARTNPAQAERLVREASAGSPQVLSALIADVAGPAYAPLTVQGGIDAAKASELGRLLVEMALLEAEVPAPAQGAELREAARQASARLQALALRLRAWVAGTPASAGPLADVDRLVGHSADARLGLLAAVAPALGVCAYVADAVAAGYPLRAAPSGAAGG